MAIDANLASLAIKLLLKYEGDEAIQQLEGALGKLEQATTKTGTAIGNTEAKTKSMSERMSDWGKGAMDVGKKLTDIGDKISGVGDALTRTVSGPLKDLGVGFVKSAIEWESAFAGVRKTVDATEQEFAQMSQELTSMSERLPLTAVELAGVAEAAGQLGIAKGDVTSFTETMAKLGQATNMAAQDAATNLARFANITGLTASEYDRLGSSIVALGNNFAATESEIVDLAMRLASAGTQIGLTESEIMGFSAALRSVGVEAEAGGTAFSKVMLEIDASVDKGGKNLKQFSSVAGMSAKEFATLWKEDAAQALARFIEGLGEVEKAGGSLAGTIEELGFVDVRTRDTLMRAANASGMVADAVKTANHAWEENIALQEEVDKRNQTLESRMIMTKNMLVNTGRELGGILIPYVEQVISKIQEWVEAFRGLDEGTKRTIVTVAGIIAALGPIVSVIGNITKAIGGLITAVGWLWANPWAAGILLATAAITGLIVAFDSLSNATNRAKVTARELHDTLFKIDQDDLQSALDHAAMGREAFNVEMQVKAQVELEIDEIRLAQDQAFEDGKLTRREANALKKIVDEQVDAAIREAEEALQGRTEQFVQRLRTFTVANMTDFTKDYQVIKDIQSMVDDIGAALKEIKPALTEEQSNTIIAALIKEPVEKWPEILRSMGFKDKAVVEELTAKIQPMIDNVKTYLSSLGIVDAETQAAMVSSVTTNMAEVSAKLSAVGIDATEAQNAIVGNITTAFTELRTAITNLATGPGFGLQSDDIAALYTAFMAGGDAWTNAAASFGLTEEQTSAMEGVFSSLGDDLSAAVKSAASAEGFTTISDAQVTEIISAFLAGGDAWINATAELPDDAKTAVINTLQTFPTKAQEAITGIMEAGELSLSPDQANALVKAWIEGPDAWAAATADLPAEATTAMANTLKNLKGETEEAIIVAGADGGIALTSEQAKSLLDAWISGGDAWASATADLPAEATTAIENSLKKLGPEVDSALSSLSSDPTVGLSDAEILTLIEGYLSGNWATVSASLPPESKTAIEKAFAQVGDALKDAPPMTEEQKQAAIKAVADAIKGIISDASTQSMTGETGMQTLVSKYQEQIKGIVGELDATRNEYNALVTKIGKAGYTATDEEIARLEELLQKMGLLRAELSLMDSEIAGRVQTSIRLVNEGRGSLNDFAAAIGYMGESASHETEKIAQKFTALHESTNADLKLMEADLLALEEAMNDALASGDYQGAEDFSRKIEILKADIARTKEELAGLEIGEATEIRTAAEENWQAIDDMFQKMIAQYPELADALKEVIEKQDIAAAFTTGDFESIKQYASEYGPQFAQALEEGFPDPQQFENMITEVFGERAIDLPADKLLTLTTSGVVDIVGEMMSGIQPGDIDTDALQEHLGKYYIELDANQLVDAYLKGDIEMAADRIEQLQMSGLTPDLIAYQLSLDMPELELDPNEIVNFVLTGDLNILRDMIGQVAIGQFDESQLMEKLSAVAEQLNLDPNDLFKYVMTGDIKVDETAMQQLGVDSSVATNLANKIIADLKEADIDSGGVMGELLGVIFSGDVDMTGFDTTAFSGAIGSALKLESFLTAVKDETKDVGKALLDGVVEGANGEDVTVDLSSVAEKFVAAFKEAAGIHSPAEIMKPLGAPLVAGIVEGANEAGSELTNAFNALLLGVVAQLLTFTPMMNLTGLLIVASLIQGITSGQEPLQTAVQGLIDNLVAMFTGGEGGTGVSDQIAQSFEDLPGKINTTLGQVTTAINTFFSSGLGAGEEGDGAEGAANGLTESIVGAFDALISECEGKGKELMEAITSGASDAQTALVDAVQLSLDEVKALIEASVAEMPAQGEELIGQLQTGVESRQSALIASFELIKQNILNVINGIINEMPTKGQGIIQGLINGIQSRQATLLSILQSMANSIPEAFQSVVSQMSGIGGQIIDGLVTGIKNGQSKLVQQMIETVNAAVAAAKTALGITSPSKVMMQLGEQTGEGFALGMENTINRIESVAQSMTDAVTGIGTETGELGQARGRAGLRGGVYIENLIVNTSRPMSEYELARQLRWTLEDAVAP